MSNKRKTYLFSLLCSILVLFGLYYWAFPFLTRDIYDVSAELVKGMATSSNDLSPIPDTVKEQLPVVSHVSTPPAVKGIYMSACVAGSKKLREGLVAIATTTEINSIIIDVKDFSGKLSFNPTNPALKPYVSPSCGAVDMAEFIRHLHSLNIYVIGRVTVFQDPFYTKVHPEAAIRRKSNGGLWTDKNGLSYIDPSSTQAWDHVIAIAEASYDIGFDEINFDYIRYPSDGNVSDISLPAKKGGSKPEILESFFKYLHEHMSAKGIIASADLFGMTTTNYDDLGIGQVLERALPYFDYISPMVYPSHYPPDFNGWKNPNLVPYDLIYYVMKRGVERTRASSTPIHLTGSTRIGTGTPILYTKPSYDIQKLRPWIQDFNYGGYYGPKEVRAQIQAAYDVGLTSWLIWNPSNKYTIEALYKE